MNFIDLQDIDLSKKDLLKFKIGGISEENIYEAYIFYDGKRTDETITLKIINIDSLSDVYIRDMFIDELEACMFYIGREY